MRIFLVSLLLLFTSLVAGYGDGIIVLDQNNFDDVLSQVKYVMVEFYIPGCTSCREFAHEYAKAAQRMSMTYPHIKFFEVDGNTEEALIRRYNIQKFPTTRFFVRGSKTPLEYTGSANADNIVEWVKKHSVRISMEVQTPEDVQRYTNDNNIVGLFTGSVNTSAYEAFLDVADDFDDVVFINGDSSALKDHYGDGFILFKKFDEGENVYNGAFNAQELHNFIKLHKYPSVMPFDQKVIQRIFYEGEEAIFLFKSKSDAHKETEAAFRAAALELKGKIAMTIVNYEDDVQIPVTDLLSIPLNHILLVNKEDLPIIRLVQPRNRMRRYSLETPITVQTIKTFVDDFQNNRLKPLLASAPIPAEPYEGDVRIVVGKTFKDIVLNSGQDVVVLFCNPNHYACKNFEPIYSSIATQLKKMSNIVLTKVDTSANEVEGVKLRSIVDLRYYPSVRKDNPVEYSGPLDEKIVRQFIVENTGILGM